MSKDIQAKELLERLARDDRDALGKLFESYYTMLVRFVYPKVRAWDVAEDIAQEVFVKLWKIRHNLQINTSLKSYLFTAAKNLALNEIQKNQRHAALNQQYQEQLDARVSPRSEEELETWIVKVRQTVQDLPPRCREIFELSRFEGMTYQEIADHLSISPKTVENQMGKALSLLRKALGTQFHSSTGSSQSGGKSH